MAVGFQLYYKRDTWFDINNPKFVFTSPNMDQGCDSGKRSHIVAAEISPGTWIDDSSRNKMYMIAADQEESYTYPTTVYQYSYDDYRAPRVKVAQEAITPFTKVYLSERPVTTVTGSWFPNPTKYSNRFEVTQITPAVDNWWKLNESSSALYADSIGNFNLVSSGVTPVFYSDYAPRFDGNGIVYSNSNFTLDQNFSFSFYVDAHGGTASGIDSFGYNSTFVNVVCSGTDTYFSVGGSENNTLVYAFKTSEGEYKSDTGITLTSGTFTSIVASYDSGVGFFLYRDNNLVSSNATITGTVGTGNLCIGNTSFGYTSTFIGAISDVKYWDSYLNSNDVNESYQAGQLNSYPTCMFGSSIGDYTIPVSPDPVEMDKGLFYEHPLDKHDSHFSDTIHLFMKFGEAYSCFVTAWDDGTHSSTLNTVLVNELCKLSACVYRSPDIAVDGWPDDNQQDTSIAPVYDYVSDMPIKGNELYYGKFNLVYYVRELNIIGDILSIRPRLSTINSSIFTPGNYDFIITFHYQYT